jgi:predicted RNase H-like nuclease (RuvC/YqgF family)
MRKNQMYPEEEKLHKMEMKVTLLERDIQHVDKWCEKLSQSIEKLESVNTNLMRIISLHEQKHLDHARTETEFKADTKELHSRITTVNRELLDKIDEVEVALGNKIDNLRREIMAHEERDRTKVSDFLKEVDKYKWMLLGGAIALGWIIGNIDFAIVSKLIK